jgi:hypothetical protein
VKDALLLVDVISDFTHEDGDALPARLHHARYPVRNWSVIWTPFE